MLKIAENTSLTFQVCLEFKPSHLTFLRNQAGVYCFVQQKICQSAALIKLHKMRQIHGSFLTNWFFKLLPKFGVKLCFTYLLERKHQLIIISKAVLDLIWSLVIRANCNGTAKESALGESHLKPISCHGAKGTKSNNKVTGTVYKVQCACT